MKFQDSSVNGLKVTEGTKSVTHPRTNGRSKSNMPHQLFQSWGHKNWGGVWLGGGGGQNGCERRIEVFVEVKKNWGRGVWFGGGGGGQGGCERRFEVFVIIQKKNWGGGSG